MARIHVCTLWNVASVVTSYTCDAVGQGSGSG